MMGKNTNDVRIVPNPVTGISVIETTFAISPECNAEILNIHGETIKRFILKKNSKLYCSDLETGIYLLKIFDESQIFITKFIVY